MRKAAFIIVLAMTIVAAIRFFYLSSPSAKVAGTGNWAYGGGDINGSYYSPLMKINSENVDRLGFAWSYEMNTFRGQEATPVVVDGVIYTSGIWGHVYAVNAGTGKEIWHFDPGVPGQAGRNPCCDVVNRGVAVWNNKVYVASVDGRLHALEAATGKKIWEADTVIDHKLPYSSTGAVHIAHNVVVIGNSGGDMDWGGVRGYVSAYDLETGKFRWRFFTVPPSPGEPYEHPELEMADKTWDPHRKSIYKGGGTVWDGFAFDPELNIVYFGTGNAAPYDHRYLGPADGDDLFTASIVAVDADTGRLAWHYQETPGDRWDFDADQKLVLAELAINGAKRRVIMQASKNGFFYVLDRKTGELLSAKNYTRVTWASHVDLKTGRPAVAEGADYYSGPKNVYPSWAGAHTWPPMSYNQKTGLVYIPVIDASNVWVDMAHNGGSVKFINSFFTCNGIFPDDNYDAKALKPLFGPLPELETLKKDENKSKLVREALRAWDPVEEKIVWEQETSLGARGYDGGVMSTASGLVFQGLGNGELRIYAADSGKLLKAIPTGSHIMAAPATYMVNGEQYVAVQVGYGGTAMGVGSIPASSAAFKYQNMNRIIAFKLGGGEVPKPALRMDLPFSEPPAGLASESVVRHGEVKFMEQCSRCHAFGPSITPDLRKMSPGVHPFFNEIVLKGLRSPMGMGRFDDILSKDDVEAIHAYLIDEAWKAYRAQQAGES